MFYHAIIKAAIGNVFVSPFGSNKITVQWDHCLVGATFIGHLAYVNLLPESYNFPKPGVNSSQILSINVQEKYRKQYSIPDFTGISLTQALSMLKNYFWVH